VAINLSERKRKGQRLVKNVAAQQKCVGSGSKKKLPAEKNVFVGEFPGEL